MKQLQKQSLERAVRTQIAVELLKLENPTTEQLAVLNGLIQADPAVRKLVEVYA